MSLLDEERFSALRLQAYWIIKGSLVSRNGSLNPDGE